MYSGFPKELIHYLLCIKDRTPLSLLKEEYGNIPGKVKNGFLHCPMCGEQYSITNGIVRLVDFDVLDEESVHEIKLRNMYAKKRKEEAENWYGNYTKRAEILSTMAAMQPLVGKNALELGCGTGRFTTLIAEECNSILAVDFSIDSLLLLSQRIKPQHKVGLILADITQLKLTVSQFDRVLSTLVSNLPTKEHRLRMYKLAVESLSNDGKFIFSTHYYSIKEKYEGLKKHGRYVDGGIYREYFNKSEVKNEVGGFFSKCKLKPIKVTIPFINRKPIKNIIKLMKQRGFSVESLSIFLERIPLINMFGKLILAEASNPKRICVGDE